jgi:hypothetical protein
VWIQTAIISLNSVTQLVFVMVKCGVLFEVRAESLNIIWTIFGFKGLISSYVFYRKHLDMAHIPNIAAEWLALFRIREVPNSNLGPRAGCPD